MDLTSNQKRSAEDDTKTRALAVKRVLLITLGFNIMVASAKVIYGYASGLISLQADGFHSMFDGLSNVIALTMVTFAQKPADPEHPYGHQKLEAVASLFIGILVIFGMVEIGRSIYHAIIFGEHPEVEPGAYVVLVTTILINIAVSAYERHQGKKLNSIVLQADADHTLSDSFSAIAVLIGVIFVDFGYTYADTITACIVMLFIGFAAFRVLYDSLVVMVDTAYLDANEIKQLVEEVDAVRNCHYVRSRGLPGYIHLEFHMSLDGNLPLHEAGALMNTVKVKVKERYPEIQDILIQLEPDEETYTLDVPANLI